MKENKFKEFSELEIEFILQTSSFFRKRPFLVHIESFSIENKWQIYTWECVHPIFLKKWNKSLVVVRWW